MTDVNKHTPGPWTLDGWTIHAEAAKESEFNATGAVAVVCTGSENAWTDVANGSLIAAAPDMLDVLEWLHAKMHEDGNSTSIDFNGLDIINLSALMAKAKGQ